MVKVFIIAEAGVNHNGSLNLAKQLVDVAKEAGADAVKFQSFCVPDMICQTASKAIYQMSITDPDESQYQMLQTLSLSEQDQLALYAYCHANNILFLSSPFDIKSVYFLTKILQLPIIKIPSGEITHLPLLLQIARSGKRVILSTGMSTLGEIEEALAILAFGYNDPQGTSLPTNEQYWQVYFQMTARLRLKEKVTLLHCTSEYPAPWTAVHLNVIHTLKNAFELPVGYSDHTLGTAVAIAAVACGATVIEKHFTLDCAMQGPDHRASLEPRALKQMIADIRSVECALGNYQKIPTTNELHNRLAARKSLVSLQAIKKGDYFDEYNLGCKRPGHGLSPVQLSYYYGKCAERDYEKDELIE